MNLRRTARRLSKFTRKIALRGGLVVGGRAQINPGLDDLLRSLWPANINIPLVRIGGQGDGGYLVPDDLDGLVGCFSPGVANRADFEFELAQRGIRSYLLDGSIEQCPVEHELIDFEPKFLDSYCASDRLSMNAWMEQKLGDHKGDLLLQMDIEGYEWPSLLATDAASLSRFRIIVVEIHNLDCIFQSFGYRIVNGLLMRLAEQFHLVHTHPNNNSSVFRYRGYKVPDVLELTFIRKDRVKIEGWATQFPHPLDRACVEHRPELSLYDALEPIPVSRTNASHG